LRPAESDPVVRPGLLAILELRLRDRRAEIDVPQCRRLELIRDASLEEAQEGRL
jgi:hypothetical protein